MPTAIMKNDPLMEKIRKALKNFKENVMDYANFKLKMWQENRS